MKIIELVNGETFQAADVLLNIASAAVAQGINVSDMRKRIRIMDSIDRAKSCNDRFVMLEDAEYALLLQLSESFQFAVAHRELLAIVDAVAAAKEAPLVVTAEAT